MYARSHAGSSFELTLTLKPISLCTNQISVFLFSRLRSLVKQLERGEASVVDLKKNLECAATVLESVYVEETR